MNLISKYGFKAPIPETKAATLASDYIGSLNLKYEIITVVNANYGKSPVQVMAAIKKALPGVEQEAITKAINELIEPPEVVENES